MNHVVRRLSAGTVASVLSVTGLLLLIGCTVRPAAKPNPNTVSSSSGADLNVFISGGSPGGAGAPTTGLRVDIQVFAEKGQNPVRLIYTVTNELTTLPILAPIYVYPSIQDEGTHIKIMDTSPISGTAVVKSLQPGEWAVGSMMLQIEPMEWQERIRIHVNTGIALDSPEDRAASSQGGKGWAYGDSFATFRTKEGRVEASENGWADSSEPASTTLEDGTRVYHPTIDPNRTFPTLTPETKSTDIVPSPEVTKAP